MRLLASLLLLGFAHATTTLHYYHVASCNAGTDIGEYNMPLNATATDTDCHSTANATTTNAAVHALYVNGLDDGCALIAYTDPECSPTSASPQLATKGECFYLNNFGTIAAWRAVCGQSLASASSSLGSGAAATSTSGSVSSSSASATSSGAAKATESAKSAGGPAGTVSLGCAAFAMVFCGSVLGGLL